MKPVLAKRVLAGGALVACTLALAAGANAQGVERYGSVYGTKACGPVAGFKARCHSIVVTDAKGNPIETAAPPISGFDPTQLRDAYKITGTGSSTTIVAIVDAYGYPNAEADLGTYRTQYGLPACTTANGCFKKLNQKGKESNYPAFNLGWAQESAVDLDMVSAMCPGCTIYLVEGNTNSFSSLGKAEDTAASLGAHVISNSYGGTEGKGVRTLLPYYDHTGIAITASTGDSGYAAGVQAPADMPSVIAVGGTFLYVDTTKSRGWNETAWSGAGSGCSAYFPKPSWQTDPRCRRRMIADTSADADPSSGVAVYGPTSETNSTWLEFGGTSVSNQIVAGIIGGNGGTMNAASTIYADPKKLYDVRKGSNGSCKPKYFCTARRGYDGPTGLGTPRTSHDFGN